MSRKCNSLFHGLIPELQPPKRVAKSSSNGFVIANPGLFPNEIANSEQENKSNKDTKSNLRSKIEIEFQSNNERNKYLLEGGFMSDMTFVVDNEETNKEEKIKCHKLILATRSRVFNKLFYGPNAEQSSEIKINDIKFKDFKNMLR